MKGPLHKVHKFSVSPRAPLLTRQGPVRSLADPRLLPERPGPSPKFILLTGSEYANWQPHWPKVIPVIELEDEFGLWIVWWIHMFLCLDICLECTISTILWQGIA